MGQVNLKHSEIQIIDWTAIHFIIIERKTCNPLERKQIVKEIKKQILRHINMLLFVCFNIVFDYKKGETFEFEYYPNSFYIGKLYEGGGKIDK